MVTIYPLCEDISPTSMYEIYQRQPKRLPACNGREWYRYTSSLTQGGCC